VVCWVLLCQPYYIKFMEKHRSAWKRFMWGALWFFFGLPFLWYLDIIFFTKFIITDFEAAMGKTEQFFVYYQRLRALVECFAEAIPQSIFQLYLLNSGSAESSQVYAGLFSSVIAMGTNYMEIRRGAKLRSISMFAFAKQLKNAGLGTVPYVAGIGAGKIKGCSFRGTRLNEHEQHQVAEAIKKKATKLQDINLASTGTLFQHHGCSILDEQERKTLVKMDASGNVRAGLDINRLVQAVTRHKTLAVFRITNFWLQTRDLRGLNPERKQIDLSAESLADLLTKDKQAHSFIERLVQRIIGVLVWVMDALVNKFNEACHALAASNFGQRFLGPCLPWLVSEKKKKEKDLQLGPQPIDVVLLGACLEQNHTVRTLNLSGTLLRIDHDPEMVMVRKKVERSAVGANKRSKIRRRSEYEDVMEAEDPEITEAWVSLKEKVITQVVQLMRDSPMLAVIDLRRTGIGEGHLDILKGALLDNTVLRSLRLTDKVELRVQELRGGHGASKYVDLSHSPVPNEKVDLVLIGALLHNNRHATDLNVSGIHFERPQAMQILTMIYNSRKLRRINLRKAGFEKFMEPVLEEIISAAKHNKRLTMLQITNSYRIPIQDLRGISMNEEKPPPLKLDPTKTKPKEPEEEIDLAIICSMLEMNRVVRKLCMRDLHLTRELLPAPVQVPFKSHRRASGLGSEAGSVEEPKGSADKDAVDGLELESDPITDADFEHLPTEIERVAARRWAESAWHGNELADSMPQILPGTQFVRHIFSMIAKSKFVEMIDVSGVGIDVEYADELIEIVRNHHVLRSLKVTPHCNLKIQDLRGQGTADNFDIDYSHARVPDAAAIDAAIICALLERNVRTTRLNLRGMQLTDVQIRQILVTIKRSPALVSADLRETGINMDYLHPAPKAAKPQTIAGDATAMIEGADAIEDAAGAEGELAGPASAAADDKDEDEEEEEEDDEELGDEDGSGGEDFELKLLEKQRAKIGLVPALVHNEVMMELWLTAELQLNIQDLRGSKKRQPSASTVDYSDVASYLNNHAVDVEVICACLEQNKALTSLNLRGVVLLESQVSRILATVNHSADLKTVDLRGTGVTDISEQQTEAIVNAIKNNVVVESLWLSPQFELTIQDLRGAQGASRMLDFSTDPKPVHAVDLHIITALLEQNFAVKLLNFSGVKVWQQIYSVPLLAMLEQCFELNELRLDKSGLSEDKAGKYTLGQRLWKNQAQALSAFTCDEWSITQEQQELLLREHSPAVSKADALLIATVLKVNDTLVKLDLSKNDLCAQGDYSGIIALFEALERNEVLQTLDVSHNNFGGTKENGFSKEPFTILARTLSENESLRSLNISHTGLIDGDSYVGLEAVARALATNDTLTNLNVAQTSKEGRGSKGLRLRGGRLMLAALERNISIFVLCDIPVQTFRRRKVKELELTNRSLGGGEAMILARQIIEVGQPLGRVNLSNNCMGLDCQDGLIHMADALQFMTSLDLSHNALGKHDSQQGTVRLAEILTTNTTITELNLSHNNLSKGSMRGNATKKGLVALARMLLTNTALLSLDLSNNAPNHKDVGSQLFGKAGFGSQCTFAWNSALNENSTCAYINLSLCALLKEEVAMLALNRSKARELVLDPQVESRAALDDDEDD